VLCVVVGLGAGCKTAPTPDTGFNQGADQMTAQTDRFPFQRVWVKPGVDRAKYDYVLIQPVSTEYLLENTGWKAANPGNAKLDEAAKELAQYTEEAFDDAFRSWKDSALLVGFRPGPRTLSLELAITELVPSKAALSAVGLVAPAAGQVVVGAGAKAAAGRPSVAIEGRVRNSQTGELLMMFADREERQWRVIDVKSVTWWGHAKPIINDWARQCAELANTPSTYKVQDRSKFTLKPW
jgi:hypothetical protein